MGSLTSTSQGYQTANDGTVTGAVSVLSGANLYCRGIMNRRSVFAAVLAVFALAHTPSAWAQGNGNNGQGDDNNGQGNNGQGNGNGGGNGNTNGNGNGRGNGGGGNNNGVGNQPVSPNGAIPDVDPPQPPKTGGIDDELSESEVLAEVEAGRAVSLSSIMPDIRTRTGGEIIDAQLEQVGSFLLYAVTVLTPEGKVTTEYYYARSGLHVEK